MYVWKQGSWIYKGEKKVITITVTHRSCIAKAHTNGCLIRTESVNHCYFRILIDNLYKHSPTDLVFQLSNGDEIGAHRSVVHAICPAWAALLDSDMIESRDGVIVLEDIEPDIAKAFVRTLYYGMVEDGKLLPDIAELADRYRAVELLGKLIPAITDALEVEDDQFYRRVIRLVKKLANVDEKNVLKDKLYELNKEVTKEAFFKRLGV